VQRRDPNLHYSTAIGPRLWQMVVAILPFIRAGRRERAGMAHSAGSAGSQTLPASPRAGPDEAGMRAIETFLESADPPAPPRHAATCGGLRAASVDLPLPNELTALVASAMHMQPHGQQRFDEVPRHNKRGSTLPSSIPWYQHSSGSVEPLKAHDRRPVQPALNRNDFVGTLTATDQERPADPSAAAKRLADTKTPRRGPKGLHNFAVGRKTLPKSHDIVLSITSDLEVRPEDEAAQPDSRFPPADNEFRIVGKRENLRFNRTIPSKFKTGALRASMSSVPSMEETIRPAELYPRTMTDRAGGPRINPPDGTFSILNQSLPLGLLKHDRRVYHSMPDCLKYEQSRPQTSWEEREKTKQQNLAEYTVKAHASYEEGKTGFKSMVKKSRLGHGNPVTWKTPRFTVGKEQIEKTIIPIPEENLRLRTSGPCLRRPPDPNKPPQTVRPLTLISRSKVYLRNTPTISKP